MVSVVITSFKEPQTIGKAINAFLNQDNFNIIKEIIVVAPDDETLDVAKKMSKENKKVKFLKDPGKGKPTALNLVIPKTQSGIIVLSDGDVQVDKFAVNVLLKAFRNDVGAVSGRVIQSNEGDGLFEYWAKVSANAMDTSRRKKINFCTGYLYAIRKKLYSPIPLDIFADDAYISLSILRKGKNIIYEPQAKVYVRYPDNLIDWIRQKKRTAGKIYQLNKYFKIKKEREFISELKSGLISLNMIKILKHIPYLIFLAIMRLYIWFRIFFDFRLRKRKFEKVWLRPISTKKSF
ncbi:hypothetical protein AUJ84_01990 [Candidatus Pacearchaeota archaeon CG1_02_32_132]|nr:MAG: hypothetical protein AUJ84_01990 [Candidatus Pacearchaeota archaeon CG1_02_32_132]